jgi:hypothetical protein
MLTIRVTLDVNRLRNDVRLSRKQVDKATARALNRAIDNARFVAVREIAKMTRIPSSRVRSRTWVRGATPINLVAVMDVLPYAPNLRAFNARQNSQGVAASAWERRKTYKRAFILPSGRVVARVGKERLPTKPLYGPSVPNTFRREVIQNQVRESARAIFNKNLEREITRRLGKGVP